MNCFPVSVCSPSSMIANNLRGVLIRSIRKDSVFWHFPEVSQLVRTTEPEPSGFSCAQFSFEPFLSLLILPQSRQGTYFSSVRIGETISQLPRKTGWPGSTASNTRLAARYSG